MQAPFRTLFLIPAIAVCLASCKHKMEELPALNYDGSGYPDNIAAIVVGKCATAGCHNSISYANAAGLLMDTWAHMFEGGNNGAVVVPYSTAYSPLLYFINTDSTLGPVAVPSMPANGTPLTRDEYLTVRTWIQDGAPDKYGNIVFASDGSTRQKHYLTMQGCDQVAVIDGTSKLVTRYIDVGSNIAPERPHCVRFSKDGRHAFVCFLRGEWVQKIDAATDKMIQQVYVGKGDWNIILPSADGSKAIVSDVEGRIAFVDFDKGNSTTHTGFTQPHGIAAVSDDFRTFYITTERSNGLYKIQFDANHALPVVTNISLNNIPFTQTSSLDPHELLRSPDGKKLFVTCQKSNDVRVLDIGRDSLVKGLPAIIPAGISPLEMAISLKQPYLFVVSNGDPGPTIGNATFRGAVRVINYNTHQLIGTLEGNFADPHGIAVDDKNGVVYVAHVNPEFTGLSAHHSGGCGGKNGYYTLYDLYTLKPVSGKRYEVLPTPYGFDTRFK